MWDDAPPRPFLAAVPQGGAVVAPATTLATDAAAFFGGGGAASPALRMVYNASVDQRHAALIAGSRVVIQPGATQRLHYVWGYVQHNQTEDNAARLVAKYKPLLVSGRMLAGVVEEWKQYLVRVSMPSQPWLGDELAWHSYYVASWA